MTETSCAPVELEASRGHRVAMAEPEASLSLEMAMAEWMANVSPVMAMVWITMMVVVQDACALHCHGRRLAVALHS